MHLYQLKSRATPNVNGAARVEVSNVLAQWNQLEPCQFSCGGKIVRSGECSNHCPPSRGSMTSEAFADYSGFSEAFPIHIASPQTWGYSRWAEPLRVRFPVLVRQKVTFKIA